MFNRTQIDVTAFGIDRQCQILRVFFR